MREQVVEATLVRGAAEAGGLAVKHVSPGRSGDPDRLVVIPRRDPCPTCGSRCVAGLVELKAPGRQPRPLQNQRIREWESLGLKVAWADSKERVEEILKGWLD